MLLELLLTPAMLFSSLAYGASINDSIIDSNVAQFLEQHSIIYALSSLAKETPLSQPCREQLMQFHMEALRKSAWAMKMLDASGQHMPGFLFGHNYWLGNRQICRAVQQPVELLISTRYPRYMHWSILKETAPFDVGFNVIYLKHASPWQIEVKFLPKGNIIQLGLCTPSACSADELKLLIEQFLVSDLFPARDFYELKTEIFYIKMTPDSWLPGAKFYQNAIFICIASVSALTLLLMIMAKILARKHSSKVYQGKFAGFIQCFNVGKNAAKIFDNGDGVNAAAAAANNDVPLINGLRVTVSILIVLVHVTFFSEPVLVNEAIFLTIVRNSSMLICHIIVDFFFFISGFLQAYKFLNSARQMEAIRESQISAIFGEFFKRLFHRWLRLAPLFYVIICLDAHFMMGVEDNLAFHAIVNDNVHFAVDWWRYLLFIHNFIDNSRLAATWTWSLACEMQFFIAGTVLLLIYAKKPGLAKIIFLAALGANFGFYYNNGISTDYSFFLDDFIPKANAMYINSLVRCTPYLFGILCGWYLSNQKRRLNALAERVIGNTALLVFLITLLLLNNSRLTSGVMSTTILIITRICVSCWTGWLIVAAISNRSTWISPYFELSAFRPLARLSFAFYLLHPILIISVTHAGDAGLALDIKLTLVLLFGYVTMSFFGATVLSLAFELPYCNLSSLILKRKA